MVILAPPIYLDQASSLKPRDSTDRTTWENPWTLTTFRETGKANSTFFSFPKVIWNGSDWVDYIFNSADFSGGIGSVYLKICPSYTVFFDPYRNNESISRESWSIDYLDKASGEWKTDDPVKNEISCTLNSSGIYFSRKTVFESGSSVMVWYWLRIGSKLKILSVFNSVNSGEYRLIWNLEGIFGEQIRHQEIIENITEKTITDKACSWVQFTGQNESKCLIDWFDTYFVNSTSGEWETSFTKLELTSNSSTGCSSARLFFGSFSLDAGKWFCLDPSISTFNSNPALDGYIQRYGTSYPPSPPGICYTGSGAMVVGQEARRISGTTNYYQWRSYVSFDTSSIPALSYNLSATLKLKTVRGTDMDFNVSIMGGSQPIYKDTLNTSAWDKGTLELARWDTQNYPGEGVYVNITVPGIQINKVSKTQFELKSDREGTSPMLYTLESVQFYSGDSTGNEPKLEVAYYLDQQNINGINWYYRNASRHDVVIVLFGGYTYFPYDFIKINCIDHIGWPTTEKTKEKIEFIDYLISSGFSVVTNKDDLVTYMAESSWVKDATMWLVENQSYNRVFVFGFSGGGVVVAKEIQKDYATRFSAAVITCALVDWDFKSNNSIYQSAHTASAAKVATCFPEGVDDGFYHNMSNYYDNVIVQKEWHNWDGGHDFFSKTCRDHPNENASTVVINWYNAAHPPSIPFTPSGARTGCTHTDYSYSSGTFDSNSNNVKYEFSWGDGTSNTTSWYSSGTNATLSHLWTTPSTYNVSVRAQDSTGLWSILSPNLTVTIKPPIAAMKTTTSGVFYIPNVTTSLLRIYFVFSDENLVGDQIGTQVGNYPFPVPDGTVDIFDAVYVGNMQGLTENQTGWNYMADIIPDRVVNSSDFDQVILHIDYSGEYIVNLSDVVVAFNVGGEKSPDQYGFVEIPQNATTLAVERNGIAIGATVFFFAP